jgi:RNA polymerase sigma-70 factor (ECF subfamily)
VSLSDLSHAELFSTCAHGGDAAAWEGFIRRFNPVIARSVLRVALRHGTPDKSQIDDLIQETYLKICAEDCKLLRGFTPQRPESYYGFLKVVATNVAQDFFKSRLAEKRAPGATAESLDEVGALATPDCSKNAMNRTERAVLIDQIDRKLKEVVAAGELQRARTIFWLYYRSGFTARAIASLPTLNLTTKGVESLLLRLTRLVRENLSNKADPGKEDKKGFRQAESF